MQRHEESKCCWECGANRIVHTRVATNPQFGEKKKKTHPHTHAKALIKGEKKQCPRDPKLFSEISFFVI